MEPETTNTTDVSIGDILSRAFNVYSRKFLPFLILSVLVNLPAYLITIFAFDLSDSDVFIAPGYLFTNLSLSLISSAMLTSAVIKLSFNTLNQQSTSIGESLQVCLKNFFPLLIASVCLVILEVLGFICLLIPGLIIATRLYLTIPALTVESLQPFDAISRSNDLTNGYRWKIFGIILCIAIPMAILNKIAGGVMMNDPYLAFNIIYAFSVLIGPLISIASTVAYYDIRNIKEGVNLEELAKAFD